MGAYLEIATVNGALTQEQLAAKITRNMVFPKTDEFPSVNAADEYLNSKCEDFDGSAAVRAKSGEKSIWVIAYWADW